MLRLQFVHEKFIWLIASIIVLACNPFIPPLLAPTPDDFSPSPPMTPIVGFPQVTATTTIEPDPRLILPDDMDEAETFFLIVKTSIAAGDDIGVSKMVKYPIHVNINGWDLLLHDSAEFVDAYDQIFDPSLLPPSLTWTKLNYPSSPMACSGSQFLITQINKKE